MAVQTFIPSTWDVEGGIYPWVYILLYIASFWSARGREALYGYFVCMHLFLCVIYVLCDHGSQMRVSGPLELEIQVFIEPHVGARNESRFYKEQVLLTAEPSLLLFLILLLKT